MKSRPVAQPQHPDVYIHRPLLTNFSSTMSPQTSIAQDKAAPNDQKHPSIKPGTTSCPSVATTMAARFTQDEIDNKVMRMMTRAFVLANYYLNGYDKQDVRDLYGAMASAYRYGPMENRQITAYLICTSSDTFRATATAIDMLLCAVLRAPAGETPP